MSNAGMFSPTYGNINLHQGFDKSSQIRSVPTVSDMFAPTHIEKNPIVTRAALERENTPGDIIIDNYHKYWKGNVYNQFGIDVDPLLRGRHLSQSSATRWGNAGIQFVGTMLSDLWSGAGSIMTAPTQLASELIKEIYGADNDTANAIIDILKNTPGHWLGENIFINPGNKVNEWVRSKTEIYTDPTLDSLNTLERMAYGGGWWAANAPTLASAISSVLPVMGQAKLIGMGAKYARAASIAGKGNRFTRPMIRAASKYGQHATTPFANTLRGTIYGTHLDVTMETSRQYTEMINVLKSERRAGHNNLSDEEIRKVADDIASKSYRIGYLGEVAGNFLSFGVLFGGGGKFLGRNFSESTKHAVPNLTRHIQDIGKRGVKFDATTAIAEAGKKAPVFGWKRAGALAKDLTIQFGAEGWEELWIDYALAKGEQIGREMHGVKPNPAYEDYKGWNGFINYLSDGKNYDSFFWGGLGGIFATGLRPTINRVLYGDYQKMESQLIESLVNSAARLANSLEGIGTLHSNKGNNATTYIGEDGKRVYLNDKGEAVTKDYWISKEMEAIFRPLFQSAATSGNFNALQEVFEALTQVEDLATLGIDTSNMTEENIKEIRDYYAEIAREIAIGKDIFASQLNKNFSFKTDDAIELSLHRAGLLWSKQYNQRLANEYRSKLDAARNEVIAREMKNLTTYEQQYLDNMLIHDEIQTANNNLKSEFREAERAIKTYNDEIANINKQLKELDRKLKADRKLPARSKGKISFRNAKKLYASRVAAYNKQVAFRTEVNRLQQRQNSINFEINENNERLGAIKPQLQELLDSITRLKNKDKSDLQSWVEKNFIDVKGTELETIKNAFSEANSNLSMLNIAINNLDSKQGRQNWIDGLRAMEKTRRQLNNIEYISKLEDVKTIEELDTLVKEIKNNPEVEYSELKDFIQQTRESLIAEQKQKDLDSKLNEETSTTEEGDTSSPAATQVSYEEAFEEQVVSTPQNVDNLTFAKDILDRVKKLREDIAKLTPTQRQNRISEIKAMNEGNGFFTKDETTKLESVLNFNEHDTATQNVLSEIAFWFKQFGTDTSEVFGASILTASEAFITPFSRNLYSWFIKQFIQGYFPELRNLDANSRLALKALTRTIFEIFNKHFAIDTHNKLYAKNDIDIMSFKSDFAMILTDNAASSIDSIIQGYRPSKDSSTYEADNLIFERFYDTWKRMQNGIQSYFNTYLYKAVIQTDTRRSKGYFDAHFGHDSFSAILLKIAKDIETWTKTYPHIAFTQNTGLGTLDFSKYEELMNNVFRKRKVDKNGEVTYVPYVIKDSKDFFTFLKDTKNILFNQRQVQFDVVKDRLEFQRLTWQLLRAQLVKQQYDLNLKSAVEAGESANVVTLSMTDASLASGIEWIGAEIINNHFDITRWNSYMAAPLEKRFFMEFSSRVFAEFKIDEVEDLQSYAIPDLKLYMENNDILNSTLFEAIFGKVDGKFVDFVYRVAQNVQAHRKGRYSGTAGKVTYYDIIRHITNFVPNYEELLGTHLETLYKYFVALTSKDSMWTSEAHREGLLSLAEAQKTEEEVDAIMSAVEQFDELRSILSTNDGLIKDKEFNFRKGGEVDFKAWRNYINKNGNFKPSIYSQTETQGARVDFLLPELTSQYIDSERNTLETRNIYFDKDGYVIRDNNGKVASRQYVESNNIPYASTFTTNEIYEINKNLVKDSYTEFDASNFDPTKEIPVRVNKDGRVITIYTIPSELTEYRGLKYTDKGTPSFWTKAMRNRGVNYASMLSNRSIMTMNAHFYLAYNEFKALNGSQKAFIELKKRIEGLFNKKDYSKSTRENILEYISFLETVINYNKDNANPFSFKYTTEMIEREDGTKVEHKVYDFGTFEDYKASEGQHFIDSIYGIINPIFWGAMNEDIRPIDYTMKPSDIESRYDAYFQGVANKIVERNRLISDIQAQYKDNPNSPVKLYVQNRGRARMLSSDSSSRIKDVVPKIAVEGEAPKIQLMVNKNYQGNTERYSDSKDVAIPIDDTYIQSDVLAVDSRNPVFRYEDGKQLDQLSDEGTDNYNRLVNKIGRSKYTMHVLTSMFGGMDSASSFPAHVARINYMNRKNYLDKNTFEGQLIQYLYNRVRWLIDSGQTVADSTADYYLTEDGMKDVTTKHITDELKDVIIVSHTGGRITRNHTMTTSLGESFDSTVYFAFHKAFVDTQIRNGKKVNGTTKTIEFRSQDNTGAIGLYRFQSWTRFDNEVGNITEYRLQKANSTKKGLAKNILTKRGYVGSWGANMLLSDYNAVKNKDVTKNKEIQYYTDYTGSIETVLKPLLAGVFRNVPIDRTNDKMASNRTVESMYNNDGKYVGNEYLAAKDEGKYYSPVDGKTYDSYFDFLLDTNALIVNLEAIRNENGEPINNFDMSDTRFQTMYIGTSKAKSATHTMEYYADTKPVQEAMDYLKEKNLSDIADAETIAKTFNLTEREAKIFERLIGFINNADTLGYNSANPKVLLVNLENEKGEKDTRIRASTSGDGGTIRLNNYVSKEGNRAIKDIQHLKQVLAHEAIHSFLNKNIADARVIKTLNDVKSYIDNLFKNVNVLLDIGSGKLISKEQKASILALQNILNKTITERNNKIDSSKTLSDNEKSELKAKDYIPYQEIITYIFTESININGEVIPLFKILDSIEGTHVVHGKAIIEGQRKSIVRQILDFIMNLFGFNSTDASIVDDVLKLLTESSVLVTPESTSSSISEYVDNEFDVIDNELSNDFDSEFGSTVDSFSSYALEEIGAVLDKPTYTKVERYRDANYLKIC